MKSHLGKTDGALAIQDAILPSEATVIPTKPTDILPELAHEVLPSADDAITFPYVLSSSKGKLHARNPDDPDYTLCKWFWPAHAAAVVTADSSIPMCRNCTRRAITFAEDRDSSSNSD